MVTEKIEWTYSDRPEKSDPALPNVLLIGDSITRAYYPAVAKGLDAKANCYYFATSASVGDERIAHQLAEYFNMIQVRFDVVHFNNGMHGWRYTEDEYGKYFAEFLAAIRAGSLQEKLIWASTTPVRKEQPGGATNARIEARNAIAAHSIGPLIRIDDQYLIMTAHSGLHSDDVHFTPKAARFKPCKSLQALRNCFSPLRNKPGFPIRVQRSHPIRLRLP
jgi:hypothetical protein